MGKFFSKVFCVSGLLIVALVTLGGCSFLGKQADERLGEACSPEVRLERAQLFYDLLQDRYGSEVTKDLVKPLSLMRDSLTAGASLDPAGDAYKLQFVGVAIEVLEAKGIKTALKGFSEAVEVLRGLPELAAGVNLIEAQVGISCAKQQVSDWSTSSPPKHYVALVKASYGVGLA
ncbi:hypothetical protein [Kiloniella litopenaei]|uniref:hypothetical protein n=1 Tax=Kiloniella litopenaei TaxID=1549748 RepID=UPI003BAD5535